MSRKPCLQSNLHLSCCIIGLFHGSLGSPCSFESKPTIKDDVGSAAFLPGGTLAWCLTWFHWGLRFNPSLGPFLNVPPPSLHYESVRALRSSEE